VRELKEGQKEVNGRRGKKLERNGSKRSKSEGEERGRKKKLKGKGRKIRK
jgi:hypothetical protein